MNDDAKGPVIAGLVIGIAFIVLLASNRSTSSDMTEEEKIRGMSEVKLFLNRYPDSIERVIKSGDATTVTYTTLDVDLESLPCPEGVICDYVIPAHFFQIKSSPSRIPNIVMNCGEITIGPGGSSTGESISIWDSRCLGKP